LFDFFPHPSLQGSRDEMTYHKDSCLKLAYRLLCEIPEREKENLAIVISKAGDKVKRVASECRICWACWCSNTATCARQLSRKWKDFCEKETLFVVGFV
jgi:hypothetical protein